MLTKEQIIEVCKDIFIKHEIITKDEDVFLIEQKANSLDSLTNVTVLMEIEEKFNFSIPDEYLAENVLSNIKSLIGLIQKLSVEQ